MIIEWQESFRIGNAEIDAQHQHLFGLANRFVAASGKAQLTDCAMQLYRYTREHFAHEEALMREIHFPAYESHVASHNQFITLLNEVSLNIANDSLKKGEVLTLMMDWALHHIPHHDSLLAEHLAQRQTP